MDSENMKKQTKQQEIREAFEELYNAIEHQEVIQ
jgi:hypothetical protein